MRAESASDRASGGHCWFHGVNMVLAHYTFPLHLPRAQDSPLTNTGWCLMNPDDVPFEYRSLKGKSYLGISRIPLHFYH